MHETGCSGLLEEAEFSGRLWNTPRLFLSPGQGEEQITGLSRADWEIGVVRHVAPPMGLVSNFLGRPASS